MFARGDVVQLNLKRTDGLREVGILKDADHLISAHDGKVRSTAGYEMTKPPIYAKDGKRFVPSGEYRKPTVGETWLFEGAVCSDCTEETVFTTYRAILLPIPDLPEEECKSCCIIAGKFVPVDTEGFCVKCGKEVVDLNPDHPKPEPEHEFAVGKFVRCVGSHHKGEIFKVDSLSVDGWVRSESIPDTIFNPKNIEKIPGRPLTTDDLMQVLSGKKITVECHAECCVNGKGHPVSGGIIYNIFKHTTYFFHANQFHQVLPSAALAELKGGSIVFADGVEGNIYVVEA